MKENYDDFEMKEYHISQDEEKSSKENDTQELTTHKLAKKNTQVSFKVIKNKNKHQQESNSTNSDNDDKKKELEVLLDKFNMNLKHKKKTENYIELLIGKIL
jgi:hypothetical protein